MEKYERMVEKNNKFNINIFAFVNLPLLKCELAFDQPSHKCQPSRKSRDPGGFFVFVFLVFAHSAQRFPAMCFAISKDGGVRATAFICYYTIIYFTCESVISGQSILKSTKAGMRIAITSAAIISTGRGQQQFKELSVEHRRAAPLRSIVYYNNHPF